jgi:formylglycine-generating enzyme required for sulfatase activity
MDEPYDADATIRSLKAGQLVFGRYLLQRVLGRGGMGIVWLAEDQKLLRPAALKFLPETVILDEIALDDLKRETRKALDLTHPHVVRIHDLVEGEGRAAIAMEFIDGPSLAKRSLEQAHRVFAPEELLPWLRQLAAALDYAHQKARLVHRDLKPANLMIGADGELKVADFGISATLSDTATRLSRTAMGSSGTPPYMSPQQMLGRKPAVTDDVYGLGATIYDLVTGKPPFYTGNILMQVQGEVPPSMAERRADLVGEEIAPGLPPILPEWEATIAACLAKDPAERPQSAGEVVVRLEGRARGPVVAVDTDASVRAAPKVAALRSDVAPTDGRGSGTGAEDSNEASAAADEVAGTGQESRKKGRAWALTAGVVVLLVAGVVWALLGQAERSRTAEAARVEGARIEAERIKLETAQTEERNREQARLAAARGGLILRTEPSGAEVRVAGGVVERSPATIKGLKLGTQQVVVELTGYDPVELTAKIEEDKFTDLGTVPLRRQTGGLVVVVAEPVGAKVEVRDAGGAVVGKGVAPLRLADLPTGAYTAAVSGERFRPGTGRQGVEKGKESVLTVTLEAQAFGIADLQIDMMPIPAGAFTMGSPSSEPGRSDDEVQHEVTISRPYWLGKTEVTVGQWKAIMPKDAAFDKVGVTAAEIEIAVKNERGQKITRDDLDRVKADDNLVERGLRGQVRRALADDTLYNINGKMQTLRDAWGLGKDSDPDRRIGNEDDDLPMHYVNWEEAMEFCRLLTQRERAAGRLPAGYAYTLPTEAQWEYACRAGSQTALPTGPIEILGKRNAPALDQIAWYGGNSSQGYDGSGWDTKDWPEKQYPGGTAGPRKVGMKAANAWGLHDMLGNMFEWTSDWYGAYPGGSVTDPSGAASGTYRVFRGGSWDDTAAYCRSAFRGGNTPGNRNNDLGFRVALSSSP